jgi:hypothetical protein
MIFPRTIFYLPGTISKRIPSQEQLSQEVGVVRYSQGISDYPKRADGYHLKTGGRK